LETEEIWGLDLNTLHKRGVYQ